MKRASIKGYLTSLFFFFQTLQNHVGKSILYLPFNMVWLKWYREYSFSGSEISWIILELKKFAFKKHDYCKKVRNPVGLQEKSDL